MAPFKAGDKALSGLNPLEFGAVQLAVLGVTCERRSGLNPLGFGAVQLATGNFNYSAYLKS